MGRKIGEARLDTHTYHVGNSPITVRGGINAGYWKEGSVKGSHKEYYAEVSHDPIKLGKNADLRFLGGYQRDYYGYDGSIRSMPYWGLDSNLKLVIVLMYGLAIINEILPTIIHLIVLIRQSFQKSLFMVVPIN